ncbi:MAG TPA: TIGR03960 family B12-binding radical SAM protein [Syntrophales bacterium]|nr:TIGR03960 family B12-binding radical SAM protein [Syntrophales bacterium]
MSCHGPQHKLLETFLALVEKPSRYIGGEVNSAKKDRSACRLSVALAFPDAYEVGMSHLGLQILYAILNSHPDICAERVYAPWPDMEARLRANGLALSSLESGAALSEFDLIGFSLQYELSYTNVLTMLELGGVPLRSSDRREGDPFVIAGGPCVFNPLPMAPFFDAVVIGEGEEVISEIADVLLQSRHRGLRRKEVLERLSGVAGVFVPSVFRNGMRIRKRIIPDLDRWLLPVKPVVPLMNTIHDRISLEIARGCTRGCRFCQAGMVWRPVRERNPSAILAMAEEALAATGYDEITLLSLSSGDYSRIEPLLKELMDRYCERRVALGLPSLRVETLSPSLIEEIRKVRKTSFTLAPEAGTPRLRAIINKGNTGEDLIATARRVYEGGWKSIKLYFMIGLPGEQEEDLEGIADLAHRVMREGRGRQVTVGLSTMVPKPHTPFQWARQISLEETLAKQAHLKRRLKNRNISFKWHDARMSLLEGLFSRGDERLADLVENAWRRGARFDGWSDRFRFELWEQALGETGIGFEDVLRERAIAEPLPWEIVDTGLDKDFLLDEYEKSQRGEATPDCRIEGCRNCGVCAGGIIATREATETVASPAGSAGPSADTPNLSRWRLAFAKTGPARFLSHLEVSSAITRAINRSGLAIRYSEGFHPHPKVSFAFATAVGMESLEEFADIQVEYGPIDATQLCAKINAGLPEGLEVRRSRCLTVRDQAIAKIVRGFRYRATLPPGAFPEGLEERIAAFLAEASFIVEREGKDKTTRTDVRPFVEAISCNRETGVLEMALRFSEGRTVRPAEILTHALGLNRETVQQGLLVKTETILTNEIRDEGPGTGDEDRKEK